MKPTALLRDVTAALVFLFLFVAIPIAVFQTVRSIDSAPGLSAQSGSLIVESGLENRLYPVLIPKPENGEIQFSVVNRSDEPLAVSWVGLLYFPHKVFLNGELVSQNILKGKASFDLTEKSKQLNIPPGSKVKAFWVEGPGVGMVRAYLGSQSIMRMQDRISTEVNSFLVTLVLALGFLSIVVSVVFRHFNGLSLAVILTFGFCLLKLALLDTSPILTSLFSFEPQSFQFWFIFTTIGFSFSLFLVYLFFFDVRPRGLIYSALAGYLAVMLTNLVLTVSGIAEDALLPLILAYRVILFLWILGYAVMTRKPFARCIFATHAVSDGLITYYAYLNHNPEAVGTLAFYVDVAFLGFSIQFLAALILIVYLTLVQSRDYKQLVILRGLEHDLKIPLSVIKLNHQMMQRYNLHSDDENASRFSSAMDRAIEDLEGMMRNLRYQLEAGPSGEGGYTALSKLYAEIDEEFKVLHSESGTALTVGQVDPELLVSVDPDVLRRILDNLIDNAFKHGTNKTRISLTAETSFGRVNIRVRDNGNGMTRSQRRHVTQVFYKADPSRSNCGLGLGLHLVQDLVRRNRGTLIVRSKPGIGTTVTVTMPRAPSSKHRSG